jgi:hypothetical protein
MDSGWAFLLISKYYVYDKIFCMEVSAEIVFLIAVTMFHPTDTFYM